jgi:uncharacterized membrane protein
MTQHTERITVDRPCRVVYDQWTQFEQFPHFMEAVERVVQVDDRTLDWTASIGGKTRHWRAEITRQEPDRVIAWRSVEGARNDGEVRFRPLDAERTEIELILDVEPDGIVETAGDALGFVGRQAREDMERFKAFIEARGTETGAWRGTIEPERS